MFFFSLKVFINEVDNDPANQALEIVLNYIKKNPSLGLSVQLMPIEGNRTDSKKFLENSKFPFIFMIFFIDREHLEESQLFFDNVINLFFLYSWRVYSEEISFFEIH